MRRTNLFPLFLFILFNAIIVIGAGSFMLTTLLAAWASLIGFLATPLLMLGAHFLQWHSVSFTLLVLGHFLALLALITLPLLLKFTRFVKDLISLYCAYNIKIYHR